MLPRSAATQKLRSSVTSGVRDNPAMVSAKTTRSFLEGMSDAMDAHDFSSDSVREHLFWGEYQGQEASVTRRKVPPCSSQPQVMTKRRSRPSRRPSRTRGANG